MALLRMGGSTSANVASSSLGKALRGQGDGSSWGNVLEGDVRV